MRPYRLLPAIILIAGPVLSQPAASTLDSLAWLSGCWQTADPGSRVITEQWTTPLGDMMMGMARTVENGRTVEYEYIRLEQAGPGTIRYVARPSGQAEASFVLVRHEKHRAVFENPAHDFPQRILYQLVTPDSLVARIEGVSGGRPLQIDFAYRRVRCN